MYADFELAIPETLDAALAALAPGDGETHALAGGTNVIVDLRARRATPARLVGLGKIEALRGIRIFRFFSWESQNNSWSSTPKASLKTDSGQPG